tara:strand:+ start:557 stop:1027 length:471 start_codon:yes stop_codon:yes gene_type:complete
MGNAVLKFFFYVNHPDNMTEEDNKIIVDYYKSGNKLPDPLEIMKGIKIDVTNEENKELVQHYNDYIKTNMVRSSQFDKDDADDDFVKLREQIIEKGEEIDMVDTSIVPFGNDWRDLKWPKSLKEQFSKRDGKEQQIVKNTIVDIMKEGMNKKSLKF